MVKETKSYSLRRVDVDRQALRSKGSSNRLNEKVITSSQNRAVSSSLRDVFSSPSDGIVWYGMVWVIISEHTVEVTVT